MEKCCGDCLSRRRFLELSSKSISAVALAGPMALLSSCGQEPLASGGGSGNINNIPNSSSGIYTLTFANFPALQSAGGSVRAVIAATSGSKDVYITRVSSSKALTVSTVCTHAGCVLNTYNSSSQQYVCACHGSVFNSDGSVNTGPATTALSSYTTSITSTGLQVTIA